MKQDCTVSPSTADERNCFHTIEDKDFQKGTSVSGSDNTTGSVVEKYTEANLSISWCYLFVHHRKVMSFEEELKKDGFTYFIHKTIKYVPRHKNKGGVREIEKPTVSGLIFIKGDAETIQNYLDEKFPSHKLCKNCSTGKVATIPGVQMEPFMRVAETDPERIRFLLHPFFYYSKNRTLLRIVSGSYAGLEGYVIRIARDRKLVMDIGGMAVAIAGVHAERFEEVNKNEADKHERATFYKRNLQEREAFIDRYFHIVKTAQEVSSQAENIDILRLQTLKDVEAKRFGLKDAFNIFHFIIEEIGYYYVPFIENFKDNLQPIFIAGKHVMDEMEQTVSKFKKSKHTELSQWGETQLEEIKAQYGYMFE